MIWIESISPAQDVSVLDLQGVENNLPPIPALLYFGPVS